MVQKEFTKICKLDLLEANNEYTSFKSIDLSNSDAKILPDNLTVRGNLDLSNSEISTLPKRLVVFGDLNLSKTKVTQLPHDLKVGKNLNLSGSNIEMLPDDLIIFGSLDLSNSKIKNLPKNLVIRGMLDLTNTSIKNIPENLVVGNRLVLNGSRVNSLPENFSIGGILNLGDVDKFNFPSHLTVGGLHAPKIGISQLPKNLRVILGNIVINNTLIGDKIAKQFRSNIHELIVWKNRDYVGLGGELYKVISWNKNNSIKVSSIYNYPESYYLVSDSRGNWYRGKTLKEAKEIRLYESIRKDPSEYSNLLSSSRLSFSESILCYRSVTKSSGSNIKDIVENRFVERKRFYTIHEIAKLTEGKPGNKKFKKFFGID